jgi:hypothetical protein
VSFVITFGPEVTTFDIGAGHRGSVQEKLPDKSGKKTRVKSLEKNKTDLDQRRGPRKIR